jgi:hypothetical protein
VSFAAVILCVASQRVVVVVVVVHFVTSQSGNFWIQPRIISNLQEIRYPKQLHDYRRIERPGQPLNYKMDIFVRPKQITSWPNFLMMKMMMMMMMMIIIISSKFLPATKFNIISTCYKSLQLM